MEFILFAIKLIVKLQSLCFFVLFLLPLDNALSHRHDLAFFLANLATFGDAFSALNRT